jgi:hypothetical protein
MLRLDDKWAPVLAQEPETGMGYQVVTVLLKDGRRYDGVVVTGGIITEVDGAGSVPFAESDIEALRVTHDRRASKR